MLFCYFVFLCGSLPHKWHGGVVCGVVVDPPKMLWRCGVWWTPPNDLFVPHVQWKPPPYLNLIHFAQQ